jgi:hypothetical protein
MHASCFNKKASREKAYAQTSKNNFKNSSWDCAEMLFILFSEISFESNVGKKSRGVSTESSLHK